MVKKYERIGSRIDGGIVMEASSQTRIYGEAVEIDSDAVKKLYNTRAENKRNKHVDAPTVLCSDTDIGNIERWTEEELERWFPMLQLDEQSIIFEIGFGTGRMSKYITPVAKEYVGIDYAKNLWETIQERSDIVKKENTQFLNVSLEQFIEEYRDLFQATFNRVFLSGGVFMYMNDSVVQTCMNQLLNLLQETCVLYFSEPVAIKERLTLNAFYSEAIRDQYSAIYRTVAEYEKLFSPFIENGFELTVSQEFFANDLKKMKETKQWIFVLKRKNTTTVLA